MHSQVFRQNKRATDVHDIIGFRIIVLPTSPGTQSSASSSVAADTDRETATGTDKKEKREPHTPVSSTQDRAMERKGGSGRARSVFTVKTFPPPYRDADSRLLHDVYEVLVALYKEVPGRFKVRYCKYFLVVRSAQVNFVGAVFLVGGSCASKE